MAKFSASNVAITAKDQIDQMLSEGGFGKYFTDHTAYAKWDTTQGWHDHQLIGRENLSLHPGVAALHYGQEIFEGLKAFRHADDSVWIFRPECNAQRFAHSAARMAMPVLPVADFVASVTELVAADEAWVPNGQGERSLYLRPFMFASQTLIGVRAADEYTYMVIATPASPFYPDPLKLWISPSFSRSALGGTGDAKCAGNYAASMAGEKEAHDNGCQQVLWLDSATRSTIEEGGTMNFFAVSADGQLITPALTGSILAGITRSSILDLAGEHGLRPVEKTLRLDETLAQMRSGEITEAFACGTAAVVSPVIALKDAEGEVIVGDGTPGVKTMELRQHLTGIQLGNEVDRHGWLVRVS